MVSSAACRRVLLLLVLALPFIAAQQATDPIAAYNVTVSPWDNQRAYPPLSLPVGSQLNFVWSGVHGVYLIPTDQCPEAWPPGPNELYAASTASAGLDNVLSVNLTTPGIFYFACQVGSHCASNGQKLVVAVTNATAGSLSGLTVLAASTG